MAASDESNPPPATISVISSTAMDVDDASAKPPLMGKESPELSKKVEEGKTSSASASVSSGSQITRQKLVTTLIVCLCNLINFMDRYALPGKHATCVITTDSVLEEDSTMSVRLIRLTFLCLNCFR